MLLVLTSPLTLVPSLPGLKYPDNLHIEVVQRYHVPMSLHMGRSSQRQGGFSQKHSRLATNYFGIFIHLYWADRCLNFMEKLHNAVGLGMILWFWICKICLRGKKTWNTILFLWLKNEEPCNFNFIFRRGWSLHSICLRSTIFALKKQMVLSYFNYFVVFPILSAKTFQ